VTAAAAHLQQREHFFRSGHFAGEGAAFGGDAVTGECSCRTNSKTVLTIDAESFQFRCKKRDAVSTGAQHIDNAFFCASGAMQALCFVDRDHKVSFDLPELWLFLKNIALRHRYCKSKNIFQEIFCIKCLKNFFPVIY
jgi:hypothetical protein